MEIKHDCPSNFNVGFFSFFSPKKRRVLKRKEPSDSAPSFSSASMVSALNRLLPSRARLHPHIDQVKVFIAEKNIKSKY
ncbi:MAG: hypothetical protein SH818_05195 [Saprospiraceae bacterium]|nr:hypothetical protein [Saprospiraceae bacterium]